MDSRGTVRWMQSAAIDIATSGVTSGVSMEPNFVLVLLGAWKLRSGVPRQVQTVAQTALGRDAAV